MNLTLQEIVTNKSFTVSAFSVHAITDILVEQEKLLFKKVIAFYIKLLDEAISSGCKPKVIQLGIKPVADELDVWAVISSESDETEDLLGEIQAKVNGYILRGTRYKMFTSYFYPEYQDETVWRMPNDYFKIDALFLS